MLHPTPGTGDPRWPNASAAPPRDRGHDGPQSVAGDERSYVHAVAWFGRFFGVRLTSVISRTCERSRFIWSLAGYQPALNQTVCARFASSGFTLKQTDLPERIPYGREPRRLPVVLGADEVVRFPGSGAQPKGACRADYGLCGRTARVGSSEPQGRQLSGARSSASDKWRNMAVNLPRQVAGRSGCDGTLWPEMNGIAGFALSHWQHKRDNIGTGWDVFMPAAMFAAALRRWQDWEYSAKEKVPMYSPTLFAAELDPIKNRGKDNALIMRGIILDISTARAAPRDSPPSFPSFRWCSTAASTTPRRARVIASASRRPTSSRRRSTR